MMAMESDGEGEEPSYDQEEEGESGEIFFGERLWWRGEERGGDQHLVLLVGDF